jgi:4-aminobutyrate aminotransferase/(S)-3-amino-2-methylpropionate transaminase
MTLPASIGQSTFHVRPQESPRVETRFRRIVTPIPAPGSMEAVQATDRLFPRVNCYQPPVVWDRAEGFQIYDAHGNCWIDFSSGAVMANAGHGHPAIRKAVVEHAQSGLLAQFSFASEIRTRLAERLLEIAPPLAKERQGRGTPQQKIYFWTTGSETTEAAFRLARVWGMRQDPKKYHVVSLAGSYHGWTMAAAQLSGASPKKDWLHHLYPGIHRMPFPSALSGSGAGAAADVPGIGEDDADADWERFFRRGVGALANAGVEPDHVAAVFVETMQGWGALPLPVAYAQALRRWADEHKVLLVFDEIQTGFGRTGKWFGHEHYGMRPDLICVGKGLTSSLPLAAVIGPAEVLDLLAPAEVTTTHAGHPLSCAAAMANLEVIESEGLVAKAAATGAVAQAELEKLRERFPHHISHVGGLGLLRAIHVRNPATGEADEELAWHWTEAAVRRGVMLFHTQRSTLKVCPPLVISPEAIVDGIHALGEALQDIVDAKE